MDQLNGKATPSKVFVSRPARAWLWQKIGKQNKKKITCTFQSLRPAGYSAVCGPEVHALSPAQLHVNRSTDAVVHWKVGKFVLWWSFLPQVKMPLVRVGIDLDREIALDWLCCKRSCTGSNFLECSEDCADISRGEKIKAIPKKGVDEQFSVHFFFAGEREGTCMEVSPWKRASVVRSFAVSLGLERKLPDHKTAWLRVQMPLAHSWQVRQLIHALFRKDSCLSERT